MGELILGVDCFLYALSVRCKAALVCHRIAVQALVDHLCCSVFVGLTLVSD